MQYGATKQSQDAIIAVESQVGASLLCSKGEKEEKMKNQKAEKEGELA